MEKYKRPDFPLAETLDNDFSRSSTPAEELSEDAQKTIEQAGAGVSDTGSITRDIDLIGLKMGILGKGEDFIFDYDFPHEFYERYELSRTRALAKAAAEVLGLEDETPLLSPATRTGEQQRVMLEIAGQNMITRMKKYLDSNYLASVSLFIDSFAEALGVTRDKIKDIDSWDDISDSASYLNRYFYAIHKDILPESRASLTDQHKEEIREIVSTLIAYRKEHGGGYFENIIPCFHLEAHAERITEITQNEFFGLPLSKVWNTQGAISAEGAEGRDINVGKKTSSGAVIVQASISGKDGEPLNLDEVQKGVQRAIGNLVYEAGGKAALPIIVTPQQIYRAFARLPSDATVTDQQAAEMERAMDVLMYAPVNLNFTAQLERHKHIKHVDDYDYDSNQAGKLGGTLIAAQKLEAETRGGSRSVAYKIYDVPVLYMYSHIVNQLAWVPNSLITGTGKAPVKAVKGAEAQNNARSVAVKQNIVGRVYRMIERQKRKESYTAIIRIDDVAEDCGINLTEKTRRTLRKNIKIHLEELKAQGKIREYSETKSGRGIAGYTVKP